MTRHDFFGHVGLALKLNARNRMAMIYGFVFPLIFLIAFWALYRYETPPLLGHVGELLTITVLGGACFGLPTTMVSERERGVWRRYKLTPAPIWFFIASTLTARFVLLFVAALIQLTLAMLLGMPAPAHPLGLFLAFVCVAAAFMGLGMVIAQIATSVPAVQALGQCIFLPMLILGGVAVRLSALPEWALHLSAFFPGRYAVAALQQAMVGPGPQAFDLAALLTFAVSAAFAAAKLFRWSPRAGEDGGAGKGWIALAAVGWLAVGAIAEATGRVGVDTAPEAVTRGAEEFQRAAPSIAPLPPAPVAVAPAEEALQPVAPSFTPPPVIAEESGWRAVTDTDIQNVAFERLPSDTGVISPIAAVGEAAQESAQEQLSQISAALADWAPGKVADPIQRVRNLLYIAAVPDALQMGELERQLPLIVLTRLRQDFSDADLQKLFYWVAMHPQEGDDDAALNLDAIGLPKMGGSTKLARERVMLYAFKLLGRMRGVAPAGP